MVGGLLLTVNLLAQNKNVVSAINYITNYQKDSIISDLMTARKYIDLAAENEETKLKAKTWANRGKIYFAILQSKDETVKASVPNAVDEAAKSYGQAIKLDDKGNFPEAKRGLANCIIIISNQGIDSYSNKEKPDYAGALASFEKAVSLNKEYNGTIDTLVVFNAALAADKAKMYPKAIEYYKQLIDLKYGAKDERVAASIYIMLATVYKEQSDLTNYLATLQNGRKAFPNDKNLIFLELNYFLETGKTAEAINNLNLAIAKEPNNEALHYNLGVLYDNLANPPAAKEKEKEKPAPAEKEYEAAFASSEAAYKKALELKPDYFDALFNLGALYFNRGKKQIDYANTFTDQKKYDEESLKAETWFQKAIPVLEKAESVKTTDLQSMRTVLSTLSNCYRMMNQMEKSKEYLDKSKNLK
jgi:tetratricopeptide (TPR) repeat protein